MSLGWGEIEILYKSRYIRNVNGSHTDPNIGIYYDWIHPWMNATRISTGLKCCVCGCTNGFGAQEIIGGHIVLGHNDDKGTGAAATEVGYLEGGSRAFIAPICKNCNGHQHDSLWVQEDTAIMQLCGFMLDMTGKKELNEFASSYAPEAKNWGKQYRAVEQKHRTSMQNILLKQQRQGLHLWDSVYLRRSDITKSAIPSPPSGPSHVSSGSGRSSICKPKRKFGYGKDDFDWS